MNQRWSVLLRFILLFILITISVACSVPGIGVRGTPTMAVSSPQVTINAPGPGEEFEPDQEVTVQSTSIDTTSGIVRVELVVDNQVIWVDANPQPQPNIPYIVAQPWTPDIPGSHVIQIRAYNVDNVSGQSEPRMVEVVALDRSAEIEESPSPEGSPELNTPTATPMPLTDVDVSPTPTPQRATATPTDTVSPTITLTPSVTPTPGTFKPTGIQPDERFKDIWLEIGGGDSRLGHPTGPEIADRNYARQYFERGMMFWWDNPDGPNYIWAIDSPADDRRSGLTSNRYFDTWENEDVYACDEARSNGDKGPIRGFGKLWCGRPELQTRLGNPREIEAGSGGNAPYAHVQFFQGGVMLSNPLDNEVFVLFDQGDWLRFGY
jgi:hypothetical protein